MTERSGINDLHCAVCQSKQKLSLCNKCHSTAYCSREHSHQDYSRHKHECHFLKRSHSDQSPIDWQSLQTTTTPIPHQQTNPILSNSVPLSCVELEETKPFTLNGLTEAEVLSLFKSPEEAAAFVIEAEDRQLVVESIFAPTFYDLMDDCENVSQLNFGQSQRQEEPQQLKQPLTRELNTPSPDAEMEYSKPIMDWSSMEDKCFINQAQVPDSSLCYQLESQNLNNQNLQLQPQLKTQPMVIQQAAPAHGITARSLYNIPVDTSIHKFQSQSPVLNIPSLDLDRTGPTTYQTLNHPQMQIVEELQSQSPVLNIPSLDLSRTRPNTSDQRHDGLSAQSVKQASQNAPIVNLNKPIIKSVEILPPGTYSADGILRNPLAKSITQIPQPEGYVHVQQKDIPASKVDDPELRDSSQHTNLEERSQEKPPEQTKKQSQAQGNPKTKSKKPASMEIMIRDVFKDMQIFGISVLDNFLGESLASNVHREVNNLYSSGIFKDGLVGMWKPVVGHNVRGDKVVWITGKESGCDHINELVNKIHLLVRGGCAKGENGLLLGKYEVGGRTPAMVACYPGNATSYRRHVDNPVCDGRLLTAIYYINPNWKPESGGTLRLYPTCQPVRLDVHPFFDRLIFFWSDKRNPHEVLPSYDVRYAITVWYFETNERKAAISRYVSEQEKLKANAALDSDSASAVSTVTSESLLSLDFPINTMSVLDSDTLDILNEITSSEMFPIQSTSNKYDNQSTSVNLSEPSTSRGIQTHGVTDPCLAASFQEY